jgi:tellurite resistance protein TerC
MKFMLTSVRRLVIAIIGGTVVLVGVALIVLPGPAFIVIPVGLAILATEFAWARRALARARAMVGKKRAQ